jgi:hypothetical protein
LSDPSREILALFEMYPLDREKERKRVERERIGVSSVRTGHGGAANKY